MEAHDIDDSLQFFLVFSTSMIECCEWQEKCFPQDREKLWRLIMELLRQGYLGLFIFGLIGTIWGLMIVASGQLFLAVRETALNTRNENSKSTTNYSSLLSVAKIINGLGWALIVITWLLVLYAMSRVM